MLKLVGEQLGNYRLVKLIGQGGFAHVYLGVHIHLCTQAAIKVLQMRLVEREMEQFRLEARFIANLVHPHIVRVLDFGVEKGIPFLVMDYAFNGSVRQRYPRGIPLPGTTIVAYIKQVAEALQYAHERKLIHRDIKPENMLLDLNNSLLLSDFGLALLASSSSTQSTQTMAGTIHYMAPEQIRGKPRSASDQYSLGIVAYEWLCGTRPFQGTLFEIANQHLFACPPSLQSKIPSISSALEEVVMTAIAKEPEKRYSTVQSFAQAFEAAFLLGGQDGLSSISTFIPQPSASPLSEQPTRDVSSLSTRVLSWSTSPTLPPVPSVEESLQSTLVYFSSNQSAPPTLVLPKHRVSRRSMLLGLAGVAAVGLVGGSTALLLHSSGPASLAYSQSSVNGTHAPGHSPTSASTQKPTKPPSSTPPRQVSPSTTPTQTTTSTQTPTQTPTQSSSSSKPTFTTFQVPTANSHVVFIAVGPDRNLWFTEQFAGKIGRMTPSGVIIAEYPLPAANSQPIAITAGPDGAIWFTERTGNAIGRIALDGTIQEFSIPTPSCYPGSITSGPDGNLWFTEIDANKIGRITPAGSITEFPTPTAGTPSAITRGPDNNLWFTEYNAGKIGRITSAGIFTEFSIPSSSPQTPSQPQGIVSGPDGNLWFAEGGGNRIGRITPSGTISEFPVPTPQCNPWSITCGSDGNLWFTEFNVGAVGQITPAGVITEYPFSSSSSQTAGIISGPGGTIWFAQAGYNQIVRIT